MTDTCHNNMLKAKPLVLFDNNRLAKVRLFSEIPNKSNYFSSH